MVERYSVALLAIQPTHVCPHITLARHIAVTPDVDSTTWVLEQVRQQIFLQIWARCQIDVVEAKPAGWIEPGELRQRYVVDEYMGKLWEAMSQRTNGQFRRFMVRMGTPDGKFG